MSDPLKEMVERDPAGFEVFPFDVDQGWQEIAPRISSVKPGKRYNPWMLVAATVTLLLIGSVSLLVIQSQESSKLSQEIFEAEYYYQEMVNAKLAAVRGKVDTELIMADFEEIDEAFAELKNDLKDNVDNEEVVQAMIANYRLKLRILEKIVSELEEESNEERKTNI